MNEKELAALRESLAADMQRVKDGKPTPPSLWMAKAFLLLKEVDRLRAALKAAKIEHVSCDDDYYSCWFPAKACTCNAEAHNAQIDAILNG